MTLDKLEDNHLNTGTLGFQSQHPSTGWGKAVKVTCKSARQKQLDLGRQNKGAGAVQPCC